MAVFAYFVLLGIAATVWSSRIPAVKHELHLSDCGLGMALFAIPCGSVLTFPGTGWLADRFDGARLLGVAGPLAAAALIAPGLAGNLPWLVIALFGFGACAGFLDVTMNAVGSRLERTYCRPLMSSFHASYSLAGLAGAGFGGLFAAAGVAPLPTFAAAAAVLAPLGIVAARWVVVTTPGARPSGAAPSGGDAPGAPARRPAAGGFRSGCRAPEAAPATAGRPVTPARQARRTAALIWILGLLALCGQVGEGAAGDWSAVYLHDNLRMSGGFAAVGLIAFSVAMTAGRVAGDALAIRFGPVRLVRGSGLVAAVGFGGGILAGNPVAGVAGFAFLGAGLAAIFPQTIAAAGRVDPARAGRSFARIAGVGYTGLLGGPVVIGIAASEIGLPAALLIPATLALAAAALAGTLRAR